MNRKDKMETIKLLEAAIKNAEKQGKEAKKPSLKAYWLGRAIALNDAIRVIEQGKF